MNEYKPLDTLEIAKIVREIDRDIYKNQLLIGSCEAKLKRVEPLSEEYNKTIELIDKTYKSILEMQILKRRAFETERIIESQQKK